MTADSYTEWDAERHGFRRWNPRAGWQPFGTADADYPEPGANGVRVLNLTPGKAGEAAKDRAGTWLRNAMIALGVLAVTAAVVSFEAQYRLVFAAKGVRVIAALEAAIPDVSALVFASLGIALALHGKRAVRVRLLNVGAVATSITMNLLAAAPGWQGLAIWIMPPVAYALASDTGIAVIRAWTIARAREADESLAEDESPDLLAVLGGLMLWVLRLMVAPPSTLGGFRRWVVESCPVAPGRRVLPASPIVAALAAAPQTPASAAITTAKPGPRTPRSAGRGRSRRPWAELSAAYRQRLETAGVTQAGYESGADISTARGHQGGAS